MLCEGCRLRQLVLSRKPLMLSQLLYVIVASPECNDLQMKLDRSVFGAQYHVSCDSGHKGSLMPGVNCIAFFLCSHCYTRMQLPEGLW